LCEDRFREHVDELALLDEFAEVFQDEQLELVGGGVLALHEELEEAADELLDGFVLPEGEAEDELDDLGCEVEVVELFRDFGQRLQDDHLELLERFSQFLLLQRLLLLVCDRLEVLLLGEDGPHVPFVQLDDDEFLVEQTALVFRNDFFQPLFDGLFVYLVAAEGSLQRDDVFEDLCGGEDGEVLDDGAAELDEVQERLDESGLWSAVGTFSAGFEVTFSAMSSMRAICSGVVMVWTSSLVKSLLWGRAFPSGLLKCFAPFIMN